MDSWERFNETSLRDKESFYIKLNMEDITDLDYRHANRVLKAFKLKGLVQYHDLYVQSDTIQLCDIYENLETCVLKYIN